MKEHDNNTKTIQDGHVLYLCDETLCKPPQPTRYDGITTCNNELPDLIKKLESISTKLKNLVEDFSNSKTDFTEKKK